ncbi:MAG TPA: lipoate--protein ligase family protein [Verrucomicrobiae bacterium]|jgi:lipoate-protein ligase A
MHILDLTLPSAAANLACDEALLDACDEGDGPEVLRFWEPREYFAVAGYANELARELNLPACHEAGLIIYRRCSGGGAVLQGPGCLNYSLVLKIGGPLETITGANRHIMERQREASAAVLDGAVEVKGCTDLARNGLKFSGNAQRRKRRALLFHGTFLLQFDLGLMERFLTMPSRQPDYRASRPHQRFVMNMDVAASELKESLREIWKAREPLPEAPDCKKLAAEKYSRDEWNLKF